MFLVKTFMSLPSRNKVSVVITVLLLVIAVISYICFVCFKADELSRICSARDNNRKAISGDIKESNIVSYVVNDSTCRLTWIEDRKLKVESDDLDEPVYLIAPKTGEDGVYEMNVVQVSLVGGEDYSFVNIPKITGLSKVDNHIGIGRKGSYLSSDNLEANTCVFMTEVLNENIVMSVVAMLTGLLLVMFAAVDIIEGYYAISRL